ncbi:MAG: ATP-binding protein [Hyphomicrobiaceae bacterium]
MTMLPRSLFGRLVLVMLAGLVAAQLVTLTVNLSERDQLLYRSVGLHAAQRIADVASMLDSMTPAERQKVVAVFDGPPLVVQLDQPPLPAASADGSTDLQLSMFATMLRHGLGDDVALTVRRAAASAWTPSRVPRGAGWRGSQGGSMMMHPMMMGDEASPLPPGGTSFIAQVRLHDGTLATFNSYLAPQAASLPVRIALTLLAALLLVIVLSLVAVRWVTVPLRTLGTAAEELGHDLNRAPLPENGPTEVLQATRAFNAMQQRLARLIAERARTFAAMSHDLKTPITRLRLRTELLDDEDLRARFGRDLDEMQAMVQETLEFLRDESKQEAAQPIDVNDLLESVQNDYQDSGEHVSIVGRATAPYVGRPLALRRCVTNLLGNAIRYGKRAVVVVEDQSAVLTLRFQDEGPGMPEEQLARAFEPFFRGEESRSRDTGGTGLGLGIARNIARAHGGDIVLRNRAGGGLEAILTLARALHVQAANRAAAA